MPPPLLFDPGGLNVDDLVLSREEFYQYMPQRHEFMLVDGVCHLDVEARRLITFAEIPANAWWARGHIPGRPLMPGVLMMEIAGQSTAVLYKIVEHREDRKDRFVGFGGIEGCKFREAVVPPARLVVLCELLEVRHRRLRSSTQGLVDGKMVFEAEVIGIPMD